MVSVLDRLPSGAQVCVIRLRSLGDCVLTTPALALLKAHRPDLQITVVVEPRFTGVFAGNPDVNAIATRAYRADLVLNLHGGTRSMWMTAGTLARFRAGFVHHRYSFIYSEKIPSAQEILHVQRPVHTAEHLASAMFYLGVPVTEIPRAKLAAVPELRGAAYAVMHPFASAAAKAWPLERFAALAAKLNQAGLPPVIVAGPYDNVRPFSQFEVVRNASIDKVKNVMAGAGLFIGNDSGPAHIAAAFGVPVVVLFGPSDPVTWAPWKTEARVLTSPQSIAQISLESVLSAVEELRVNA